MQDFLLSTYFQDGRRVSKPARPSVYSPVRRTNYSLKWQQATCLKESSHRDGWPYTSRIFGRATSAMLLKDKQICFKCSYPSHNYQYPYRIPVRQSLVQLMPVLIVFSGSIDMQLLPFFHVCSVISESIQDYSMHSLSTANRSFAFITFRDIASSLLNSFARQAIQDNQCLCAQDKACCFHMNIYVISS